MVKLKPFYVVWQDGEDEQYWNQYETLEDAVCGEDCKEVDVYQVKPQFVGCYSSAVKIVLTKKKKKDRN